MRRDIVLALVLFAAVLWTAARIDIQWMGGWKPAVWRMR